MRTSTTRKATSKRKPAKGVHRTGVRARKGMRRPRAAARIEHGWIMDTYILRGREGAT